MVKEVIGDERTAIHVQGKSVKDKLETLKTHFAANYCPVKENSSTDFEQVKGIKICDDPFLFEELLAAQKQIARRKATGSDDIPIEAYCALTEHDELSRTLLRLINSVYLKGYTPDSWREILHVPIPKKGDLSQLKNWRAICLTNHIAKLVNYMILNRLQPEIEPRLRNAQFGFRPFRSTVGAQAILTEVFGKASRHAHDLFLGFIDFQSAFPSISHDAIKKALDAFAVPPMLRQMILASYNAPSGYVRVDFGETDHFDISSGVLQGDVLAPFLFIMCLDRILERAMQNSEFGITLRRIGTKSRGMQEIKLTDIDYADDIVFFSNTKETLEAMILALIKEAGKAGMKLNVGPMKTAWMVVGRTARKQEGRIILPELGLVPRVESYRYLGHMMSAYATSATLKNRIKLA